MRRSFLRDRNPRAVPLALRALLALLLFLGVAEIGARILFPPPQYHQQALAFDPGLGFKGIPDHSYTWISPVDPVSLDSDGPPHDVRLNRDGFRGRALPEEDAPTGPKRIAFFGDSFLVGEAVSEASLAVSQVESRWNDVGEGEAIEAFNLGTIDYGTGQALLLLEELGPKLRPDIVVLAVFPENDVINNSLGLAGRSMVSPGDAIRPYVVAGPHGDYDTQWAMPARSWARRLSRLFGVVERDFFPPEFGRPPLSSPRERLRSGGTPREFLEIYAQHDPGHRWVQAWSDSEGLIRAFREQCDAIDARLLVVVIPSMHQVRITPKRIRLEIEARLAGSKLHDRVDWNVPERRLRNFLENEGIESRILLPSFREAASRGVRLYSRDRHLSAAGHTLLADVVLESLSGPPPAPVAQVEPLHLEQPVAWPAHADPIFLDVREHAHADHFADGWLSWWPDRKDRPGGWQLDHSGMLALRGVEGNFVLRGYAAGPMEFDLRFVGSPARRVKIEGAGPFEIETPNRRMPWQSSTGHVGILLTRRAGDSALFIREIGFVRGSN